MDALLVLCVLPAMVLGLTDLYIGQLMIYSPYDTALDSANWVYGASVAMMEINDNPDLLAEYNVSFIQYDSQADAGQAFLGALNLGGISVSGEPVQACKLIIGCEWSGLSMAAQPAAAALGLPMISGSATSTRLVPDGDYPTFSRVCPHDGYQADAILALCEYYGWTRVAVLNSNDGYSEALALEFIDKADNYGVTIIETVSWVENTEASLAPIAQKAQLSGANILFMVGYNTDYARMLDEFASLGMLDWPYQIMGSDSVSANIDLPLQYDGYLGTNVFVDQSDANTAFTDYLASGELYADSIAGRYGQGVPVSNPADPFSAYFYDATYLAAYSLENLFQWQADCDANTVDTVAYAALYPFADPDFCQYLDDNDESAVLLQVIRVTQFTGITGSVLLTDTGERSTAAYALYNWVDGVTSVVGTFDSARSNPIAFDSTVYFANKKTEVPPSEIVAEIPMVDMSDTGKTIWTALAIVAIVWTLAIGGVFYSMRKNRVFIAASNLYMFVFLLACVLAPLYIIFSTSQSTTSCLLRVWLPNLAVTLGLGTLTIKLWRIDQIFNSQSLIKNRKLKDLDIIHFLLIVLLLDIILLGAYTGVAGIELDIHNACVVATEGVIVSYVLFVLKVIHCFYAIYLTYKTKDTPSTFNETSENAIAVYGMGTVGVMWFMVSIAMGSDPENGSTATEFACGCMFAGIIVVVSAVFIPKFIKIKGGADNFKTFKTGTGKSKIERSAVMKDDSKNDANAGSPEQLQERLDAIKQKIEKDLDIITDVLGKVLNSRAAMQKDLGWCETELDYAISNSSKTSKWLDAYKPVTLRAINAIGVATGTSTVSGVEKRKTPQSKPSPKPSPKPEPVANLVAKEGTPPVAEEGPDAA